MMIDAGGRLKIRNPPNAPATARLGAVTAGTPRTMPIVAIAAATVIPIAAARPSSPSTRLNALVVATNQKMVIATPSNCHGVNA